MPELTTEQIEKSRKRQRELRTEFLDPEAREAIRQIHYRLEQQFPGRDMTEVVLLDMLDDLLTEPERPAYDFNDKPNNIGRLAWALTLFHVGGGLVLVFALAGLLNRLWVVSVPWVLMLTFLFGVIPRTPFGTIEKQVRREADYAYRRGWADCLKRLQAQVEVKENG